MVLAKGLPGAIRDWKPTTKDCLGYLGLILLLLKTINTILMLRKRNYSELSPRHSVRPGAAGLLIGIECSRVRDRSWMYLTSLVTTQIGVELAVLQRKLPDRDEVGLQLYSARTFHINLSLRIYKGAQVPSRNTSTPKAIQTTTQDVGHLLNSRPEPI